MIKKNGSKDYLLDKNYWEFVAGSAIMLIVSSIFIPILVFSMKLRGIKFLLLSPFIIITLACFILTHFIKINKINKEKSKKVMIGSLIISGVLFASVFVVQKVMNLYYDNVFHDTINAYLNSASLDREASGEEINQNAKIIVLNSKHVDPLFLDLPASIKADSPKEVQYVVILDWEESTYGTYSSGAAAYQAYCDVLIYNAKDKELISTDEFVGEEPPSTISGSGDWHGSNPKRDVLDYIESTFEG